MKISADHEFAGPFVAAVDVGGTNIKMGLSDLCGGFVLRRKVPTRQVGTGDGAAFKLAGLIRLMIEESGIPAGSVEGVGLVVPGVTDPDLGTVSMAPAFGWSCLPIRDLLMEELSRPVYVENDVNAAALAELQWGVGREFKDFVFLSLGTGIGAGLILDGRLYRGHLHAAGEVGYTIVDLDWVRQKRGKPVSGFGCLESLAGARGIVRLAEELGGVGKWRRAASEHTVEDIFDSLRDGDAVAMRVVDDVTDALAAGIINIASVVSPEAVVIGGGVAMAGDALLAPLRTKISLWSPVRPRILPSTFEAESGLAGAASLAAGHIRIDDAIRAIESRS